ncbi:MAG: hypothetical protein K0S78_216 [Thermomicrobiales bacterium]|nr:hypothetical protein [Thermomicrobiales bacterium]
MLGAEDARQLAFAHQSGRVFITHDADFLRLDARGYVHAGIVFVPRRMSIGAVVAGLMLIHEIWLEPNTPAGIEAFAPVLEELDRRG